MKRSSLLAATLLPGALLGIAGCRHPAAGGSDQPYSQIDPATAGAIEGTARLTVAPPQRIEIDMAQDPACAMSPAGKNYTEGIVSHEGRLANVYVYVKDGLGNRVYPAPHAPAVLDQKGCRYVPHVTAAMVGQPVEFRNSDATMHNIHMEPAVAGNAHVDLSQSPNGGAERQVFAKPELMIPIRCNNHPWMEAFLNVAPNPFFAVTGDDGRFVIRGLPPGTYTLVAVQEQLGQQQATVSVASHQTATADFHFQAK